MATLKPGMYACGIVTEVGEPRHGKGDNADKLYTTIWIACGRELVECSGTDSGYTVGQQVMVRIARLRNSQGEYVIRLAGEPARGG
jgi:hypothetical protein